MTWKIDYNANTDSWIMNGSEAPFLGDHLIIIAIVENVDISKAVSETHALGMLEYSGVDIEFLCGRDW